MMSDLIGRQATIDLWEKYHPTIAVDAMQYDAELRQLPPASCSEFPNNSDTIGRQAAIDALDEQIALCNKALGSFDISMKDEYAVKVERASLKAYRETLNVLPSAQPERTCVNCGRTANNGGCMALTSGNLICKTARQEETDRINGKDGR